MKKSFLFKSFVLLFLVVVATSCLKTKHSVRIINQYPDDLGNVTIGPADYGTVASNSTTGYIEVSEGSNTISGTDLDNSNNKLTGSVSVSGKGTHKWSVTITSGGSLSIKEDK